MRLRPVGLAARMSMLLVAAMMVTLAIYVGGKRADQETHLEALESVRIAGRVAAVYRVVDGSDAALRPELVALLSAPALGVFLGDRPHGATIPSEIASELAAMTASLLEDRLGLRPEVAVEAVPAPRDREQGPDAPCAEPACTMVEELAEGPRLSITVPLSDGTPLRFDADMAESLDHWTPQALAWILLGVGAVVGCAVWGVKRILRPLERFAAAAERIGTDLEAPPVPESGVGEVRRAAQSINLLQQRLRAYLNDRTEMLGAISHDLRTPLTRARLRADAIGDPQVRGALHMEFDEMDAMIASILSFLREKDGEGPSELVDLTAMARTICDVMADCGHAVSLTAGGRELLHCRPVSMRRCLSNVIDNAAAFGRSVQVAVGRGADGALVVTVDDDGPGVPPEHREDVFRPFYRLEASRSRDTGGAGLGLAIARGVARAHGGDVRLEDGPGGRGLRAIVTLPASA